MNLEIQPAPLTTQPRLHQIPGSEGGCFSAPCHPQNKCSTAVAFSQSEVCRNLPKPQCRFLHHLSDTILLQTKLFPESCCSATNFPRFLDRTLSWSLDLQRDTKKVKKFTRNVCISNTWKTKQAFNFKPFCSYPILSHLLLGKCLLVSLKPVQIIMCSYCTFQNLTLLTMISPSVAMEIAILPHPPDFFYHWSILADCLLLSVRVIREIINVYSPIILKMLYNKNLVVSDYMLGFKHV